MNRHCKNRLSNRHPLSRGWAAGMLCISLLGILVAGCSLFQKDGGEESREILKTLERPQEPVVEQGSTKRKSVASEEVRFDGGLLLGNTDNLAYQPSEFAELLNELSGAEKWRSLRTTIAIYPDLTMQLLRTGNDLGGDVAIRVARDFDRHWEGTRGKSQVSWEAWVSERMKQGRPESELAEKQLLFQDLLTNNKPTEALQLKIGQLLGERTSTLAQVEVLRLEGIAFLMKEDYRNAISRFSSALELVEKSHPYLASHIGLLLGEAFRHAGQKTEWENAWRQAIDWHSQWLDERSLMDPSFWKRAAFLRPARVEWPVAVTQRIQNQLKRQNLIFKSTSQATQEAVVWAAIGVQSLQRHESQNAILALKKAEALILNSSLKQELQMQQAVAMIDGGQPGPASAILLRLSSGDNLIADRAKAILATLKLQNGSLAQGMNLLQSSIKTASKWPVSERLRAEADFGLALLMRGREVEGIALLNQVFGEFVDQQNIEHAHQCLWNMARYYEKTDQPQHAASTLQRLAEMETL